jgi:S1-C subfamily serine protease
MSIYNLPKMSIKEIKEKISKGFKNKVLWGSVFLIIAGCIIGITFTCYFPFQVQSFLEYFNAQETPLPQNNNQTVSNIGQYHSDVSYEQAIIDAAKKVSPSVVSIVISKNLPVYEQQFINPFGDNSNGDPFGNLFSPFDFQIPQQVQKGTKYQEVGAGSGFIVTEDGLVLTNKHVVSDNAADYTVLTNDGQKYKAKVLALDPVQDLAVIKIQLDASQADKKFQPVTLGDSSGIQIGQTAIAIGNALGQFSNTVSVGVISGLQRTISASDQIGSFSENLEGIIQTDAAINAGNSGGPLLNLKGEVIGIDTAMAQGAQDIGFALPINMAKKDIDQVVKTNKIVYPFLGVRYVLIDPDVQKKYSLSIDYGVLVLKGSKGEAAVTVGSGADKAGIKEKDVILEMNNTKITKDNTLATMILNYNPGDKITLKILRDGKEMSFDVILGERPQ